MKRSIIITTYNRPDALALVLEGLCAQQDTDFEVLIADDGSDERTAQLLAENDYPLAIQHVWQDDQGFRAAKIRNKAVAKARGDYLIFIDGDCVPMPSFLTQHRHLAEAGWFVAGNRVLLSKDYTQEVLTRNEPIFLMNYRDLRSAKQRHAINRLAPMWSLPLGPLRKLGGAKWQGVKTCNLGVWREDFVAVNGFDEAYQGWGYEDSDLVIRLQRHGIKRKLGRFAVPVLHLWHPENDRSHEQDNLAKLQAIMTAEHVISPIGLDQYTDDSGANG